MEAMTFSPAACNSVILFPSLQSTDEYRAAGFYRQRQIKLLLRRA